MSADTTSVDHVEPSATEAAQCSDIPSCHRDAAAVLAAKYPLLLNLTWSSVPVQEISSGEASQPTDVSKSLEPAIGCWCSESFPTDGRGLLFDGLESGFLGLTPARHTAASMKAWSEGACVDDACAAAVKRVNSLVLEAFCDSPTASCTAAEAASMAEDLYKCQCAYAASGDAFGKSWRESGGEEDQARFCNFDGCAAYMSALCRVAEAGFCAERKLGDGLCPWYTDLQTLLLVVGGGVLVVLFCLCLCCFIFCCKVRCCASCWNKEEPYPDELGESSLPSYQLSGDKDRQRKARTFGRPASRARQPPRARRPPCRRPWMRKRLCLEIVNKEAALVRFYLPSESRGLLYWGQDTAMGIRLTALEARRIPASGFARPVRSDVKKLRQAPTSGPTRHQL